MEPGAVFDHGLHRHCVFYRRKLWAVGSWTRPSDATPEDRGHHYVGCLLRENDLGNNDAGREFFMA